MTGEGLEIAVLLGGRGAEREVSLATGRAVIRALRERGHRVHAVDPARGHVPRHREEDLLSGEPGRTPPTEEAPAGGGTRGTDRPTADELSLLRIAESAVLKDCDLAWLALHGGQGEDGHVQAVLEVAGVPYTGSGPLGSAIGMDKRVSKELLVQGGVPTADWAPRNQPLEEAVERLGIPLVVKPARGGSTVGLTVVRRPDELPAAVERAGRHHGDVLLEEWIPGRELTVGVLEGEALPPVEIHPGGEIYDYESKYTPGVSSYDVPADLPAEAERELMELAVRAYEILRQRTYSRVDFRGTADEEFRCLETNSLPGMTSTSLLPKAARAAGIGFADLCERIARDTLAERGTGAGPGGSTESYGVRREVL